MFKIDENMSQQDRTELWGELINVVEDWLAKFGFEGNDFDNDEDRQDNDYDAIIYGENYDYLADRFAEVIGISRDKLDNDKVKSEE